MISNYKKLFSVSALTLLMTLTPVAAIAQEDGPPRNTPNNNIQTTTVTEESNTEDTELRKVRLEERKTNLKPKLDAAKQSRIKSRCKASQGKLSSISGRINGIETSRSQVYENLVNRLSKLNDRLKSSNIDTSELSGQIVQLNGMIETFSDDLESYKLSVSDMAAMDCAADPVAFQASLESARTGRTKTAESAKAIRTFLTETIKPTLADLKTQISQNKVINRVDTESEGDQ